MQVPLFTASGYFAGRRQLDHVETLLANGRISVIRSRRGKIVRAYLLPDEDSPNGLKHYRPGQRLSHQEHLATGQ